MMERLMQSCDSMPSRNDSVRKLNFSTSIAAGITTEKNLIAARCRMLPTQKREISDVTKDDTRDDAFVASKPRVAYRWSHSDTSPSTSSHDRMPVIRAADRVSGARAYVARRLQGHPIWNQSSGWHSMRNVDAYRWHIRRQRPIGMVPLSHQGPTKSTAVHRVPSSYPESDGTLRTMYTNENPSGNPSGLLTSSKTSLNRGEHPSALIPHTSRAVIPKNLVLPKELLSHPITNGQPSETLQRKRQGAWPAIPSAAKRAKRFEPLEGQFDKLDLLCSATLELGPLQDNPTGCSCPKSKCIALYCDCFKAGRRCSPSCSCLDCKNTIEESGANGARSKAIQAILARNPRAFTSAGSSNTPKLNPGEQACNCIRSRCLKLYCTCFQSGKPCNPSVCTCVGCLNTKSDASGARKIAIQITLEKRPDAFRQKSKTKEIGAGCACKNNRCIRKYCECFRTKLSCSKKCSCRDCENKGVM